VGLWSWAKRVATEQQGQHEPVPIHLERTHDGYAFRLGLRAGIGGEETARIPIRSRLNDSPHPILKEVHWCEVGGQTLEAANPYALKSKVARLLESLAPARTLPLCFFRSPALDYELPVYEQHGEFVSPIVGGPNLKARDLAGVRRHVCRYLVSAGYVHHADEVVTGVLRPSDLSRVPPAAIFRSLADPDLWLPSVEGHSPDGPVVGVLGHAPELRRGSSRRRIGPGAADDAPAAPDVIALLRFVREEMRRARKVAEPDATYAVEVRADIWSATQLRTEDSGSRLAAYLTDDEDTRLELAVRRTGAGDYAVAIEDRSIKVFLADDLDTLAHTVGRYLASNDFLRSSAEVEIHSIPAERPERLDTDSIWTSGDAFAIATEPEEAHTQWS
jgi:hypothetical protein